MIDPGIINFIRHQLNEGKSREEIENLLISNGLDKDKIEESFTASQLNPPAPTPSAEPSTGAVPQPEIYPTPLTGIVQPQSLHDNTPKRLPGPFEILKIAFNTYKNKFFKIIIVILLPYILSGLITVGIIALIMVFFRYSLNDLLSFTRPNEDIAPIILMILFGLVFFIMFSLSNIISQISLILYLDQKDRNIGIIEAFKLSFSKIWSCWKVGALSGLILMSGFMLFIIPLIIFAVWLSFSAYIVICEDIKGLDAIIKSREYVRGLWWKTTFRVLFLPFIYYAFYVITERMYVTVMSENTAFAFIKLGIQFLLMPLVTIYHYQVYKSLRDYHSGMVFAPTKKSKRIFSFLVAFPFLLIILSVIGMIYIFSKNITTNKIMDQYGAVRDASRMQNRAALQQALEMYNADKGFYPLTLDQLQPEFMSQIPGDPKTRFLYEYVIKDDGKNYSLCIDFEARKKECYNAP